MFLTNPPLASLTNLMVEMFRALDKASHSKFQIPDSEDQMRQTTLPAFHSRKTQETTNAETQMTRSSFKLKLKLNQSLFEI